MLGDDARFLRAEARAEQCALAERLRVVDAQPDLVILVLVEQLPGHVGHSALIWR